MERDRPWEVRGGTVLIVDDDEDDAHLSLHTIKKLFPRFRALVIHSAEDLFFYLEGNKDFSNRSEYPYPNLVLLALKMAGLDGRRADLVAPTSTPQRYTSYRANGIWRTAIGKKHLRPGCARLPYQTITSRSMRKTRSAMPAVAGVSKSACFCRCPLTPSMEGRAWAQFLPSASLQWEASRLLRRHAFYAVRLARHPLSPLWPWPIAAFAPPR
jgi:hypothetical protein